jgi:hypothetical protein
MDARSPTGEGVWCEAVSWWPNTDGTRSEHATNGRAKGNKIDASDAPLGNFSLGAMFRSRRWGKSFARDKTL